MIRKINRIRNPFAWRVSQKLIRCGRGLKPAQFGRSSYCAYYNLSKPFCTLAFKICALCNSSAKENYRPEVLQELGSEVSLESYVIKLADLRYRPMIKSL